MPNVLLDELLELVEVPVSAEKDLKSWGHDACKAAREAHILAWRVSPPDDQIRKLRDLLLRVIDVMKEDAPCSLFVRNCLIRVKSLNSKLAGGPPIIPEDACERERTLSEDYKKEHGNSPSKSKKLLEKLASK